MHAKLRRVNWIPELSSHRRVVVSADGSLQLVPFELLREPGRALVGSLLDTHVLSYFPSAGVLSMLRTRTTTAAPQMVLAIGSSPDPSTPSGAAPSGPPIRGIYDIDASHLRPLPLATEEARFVGTAFGERASRVLVRDEATEEALKAGRVSDYRVR